MRNTLASTAQKAKREHKSG